VLFRENKFNNVGSFASTALPSEDSHLGAFVVAVQGDARNLASAKPVFEGLIIDSNIFTNLQGPGLYLSRADGVAVINNEFTNTDLSKVDASLKSSGLNGSLVVTLSRNVLIFGSTIIHGGPVWIDPKSTSSVTENSHH
jgi:hypothetical protein